jgi:hypothetical protein
MSGSDPQLSSFLPSGTSPSDWPVSGSQPASFAPKPFERNSFTPSPAPLQHPEHVVESSYDPAAAVESLLEGPNLSEAAMQEHLVTGKATPLFPVTELPTGPVKFAGQWWAILKSAPHLGYTLVDDQVLVGALNDTAQRRGMVG